MEEKETAKTNWPVEYQVTEITEEAALQEMTIAENITSALKFKETSRKMIFSSMAQVARKISRLYGIYPEQTKINIVSNYIYEHFAIDGDLFEARNNYDYYKRHGFGWQMWRTMGVVVYPHPPRVVENREQFKFMKKVIVYAFGKMWNEIMKNPEMRLDDDSLELIYKQNTKPLVLAERYNDAIKADIDYFHDFNTVIDSVYHVYNDMREMLFDRKEKPTAEIREMLLSLTTEFAAIFNFPKEKNPTDVIIEVLRNKEKYVGQLKKAIRLFGRVVKFFCENDEQVDFDSLKQIIQANKPK